MRRTPALAAALAASLFAATGAHAEDPKTTTDIRCVVVAYALTHNEDPDLQKLGAVSLFYFWGRLDGRGATADLGLRLTDEATKMTSDDLKAQAQICAGIFAAGTETLKSFSQAVQSSAPGAAPAK
jgi:hypothetical protein